MARRCKYGKLKHKQGRRVCKLKKTGKRRARITKAMWDQAPARRSPLGRYRRRKSRR